jgi:hypothetical protein
MPINYYPLITCHEIALLVILLRYITDGLTKYYYNIDQSGILNGRRLSFYFVSNVSQTHATDFVVQGLTDRLIINKLSKTL